MIPVLAVSPSAAPNPAPLGAPLEVAITPRATGSGVVIISGAAVAGGVATFGDLNGMIAYTGRGGGWMEFGQPRGDVSRQIKGLEDSKELKG